MHLIVKTSVFFSKKPGFSLHFQKFPVRKKCVLLKIRVLIQNSMFFKNFRTSKIPRAKKVRTFKNSSFHTKFRVFQKLPYIQKFPGRKKCVLLKTRVLTQNSVFFQKFRTFQKFPARKSMYFSKSRLLPHNSGFFTPNTLHKHKHMFFPKAFLIYLLLFTPLTSKSCQKTYYFNVRHKLSGSKSALHN